MRRVPIVFLLACVALLTLAGPALAHTELAAASPAPGDAVTKALGAITLTFTQEVDERLATVTVLDASGATIATGPPRRAGLVLLQPVSGVESGRYEVQWRAAAADGHILRGNYSFRVGGATTAGAPGADAQSLTPAEQLLAAHEGPNHKAKPSYAISAADRRKASNAAAASRTRTAAVAAPAAPAPTPDNGGAMIVTLLGAALAVTTATAVVESVRAHRV